MKEIGIDICIISYELLDELKDLVASIKQNTTLPYTITIVDNASKNKELIDYLKNLASPKVEVIFNRENLGYSKAVNQGVNVGRFPHILILNNDTQTTEAYDKASVSFMQKHKSCGVLGYKLVDKKGRSKGCGVDFNNTLRGWNKSLDYVDAKYSKPEKVKYIGGSAIFTRRDVFESVGGFCEEMRFYCEDLMYCLQAKELGFSTWYIPHIIVHHHEASLDSSKDATRIRRAEYFTKSLRILKKYFPEEPGIARME